MGMDLIIQLILGAIGGNAGGAIAKNSSLGTIGNTIAGAVGGLAGGNILGSLMSPAVVDAAAQAVSGGGFNLSNILGGAGGGLILQIVAGLIKSAMNKNA
jgi:uncharacterized membrane protein YeaQ/YmgE (transglycosylase-associated protein family)